MDAIDAASAFLGMTGDKGSMRDASIPSETHTITGTATSDSADGLVMVDLEGYTISEDDQQSLELPTTVDVHEGDTVQVTLVGGVAKSPIVTGVVGGGDRLSGNVTEALDAAQAAELIVRALNYYFFHDDAGAHVTTEPNNPNVGPNALLNALALYFRVGATPVAHFGADGSQIGKDDETHLTMDFNSMEIDSKESAQIFFVGDLRDENDEAEVRDSFIGDGTTTEFYLHNYAEEFISVTINGAETSDYTYTQPDWDWVLEFNTPPANNSIIIIEYITKELCPVYTAGIREENNTVGRYSMVEGYHNIASGFAAHAEGMGSGAIGQIAGFCVTASGDGSHAEGYATTASGALSHSEGATTVASGYAAHAEGEASTASGRSSHAEGLGWASSDASHAEGSGKAHGKYSHAEGYNTNASGYSQHVSGKFNVIDSSSLYSEIIGNGTTASALSNARTLDWNGNEELQGTIYLGGCAANGETPYSGVRHNTSTGFDEYWDGTAWKPNGPRVYSGTLVKNVGSSAIYEATIWTDSQFNSTFHCTNAGQASVYFSNGDAGAGGSGDYGAGVWSAEKWSQGNYAGWHVRFQKGLTGNRRINYLVVIPAAYSTV